MSAAQEQAKADAPTEHVPELTATQYVILAESQRKKRALAETRIKYNALVDENNKLLQEREHSEKTAYEVTESMRRDIFAKNAKIAELEAELVRQKGAYEAKLTKLQHQMEDAVAQEKLTAQENDAELREEIERLQRQVEDVQHFVRDKEDLDRERLKMLADNDALQSKLEEVQREEERRYIQGTLGLKKSFEQKLEEMKKRYEEDMDERLDASVKRILQQNRRTARELQLHIEESQLLQKENSILQEERKQLMQEVQLKIQMEQGYVTRNAKQARDIKDANEKVLALERTLQSFIEDFEKEREFMRKQWDKATEEMAKEVEGYRRLSELKTKESKNVRRLAQEVLLQRSDTETFFISSLQHVRKQIELSESPEFPSRPRGKRGVDIAELSWHEREQVLRLAFAKINNQQRSMHFRNLPDHSFPTSPVASLTTPQPEKPLQTPLVGLVSDAGHPQLA